MWLGKLSLKAAALVVVGAISSMAQGLAPLTFGNTSTDAKNWNYLINYKMWGQTAISFGNNNNFPKADGWVGSAMGNLSATGNDAQVAGAVIVGGSVNNDRGMKLTTGPVRYGGSISNSGKASGTKCQGTTTSGSCAGVPQYRDIPVPYIKESDWPSNLKDLTTPDHGTYTIDARSGSADFYFNNINFGQESRLLVLMPAGGRVTRIFAKKFNINQNSTHPQIVVQYDGESGPRCNLAPGQQSNSKYNCSGGDYEGNLIIFIDGGFTLRNIDYAPFVGTIISGGTLEVVCNMSFAGQLIAKNLKMGNEVKGDGFKFVPVTYGSNITDSDELPYVMSELVVNVNEDEKHAFTSTEFNYKHSTRTFASVTITSLPAKGTLTLNGSAISSGASIAVADLDKLTYQAKANEFGNSYTTFKYKVVGSGTGDNTSIEYTATVNVIPVNDKPSVADAKFTVNEQDHAVSGGPITVTDVSNENDVDTYTYTLDATSADYSAFNSAFEIVPSGKGKTATIKVKTGATLDYSQKKEYVVYATVKDDAKTEKTKIAGSLTSELFTITISIIAVIDVNDKFSSSSVVKSSSSKKAKSSSSSAQTKSSSSGKIVASSSSQKVKPSSSSTQTKSSSSGKATVSSSSSSEISDVDDMDFYVRMTGTFEFEIVIGENMPDIAKKYAVMDMKGQVLSVGELRDKNARMKVSTAGAYIVKIGLGYRRVNIR